MSDLSVPDTPMGEPVVLSLQPAPADHALVSVPPLGIPMTAIARTWSGDDYLRCNLCSFCMLRDNPPPRGRPAVCLVLAAREVGHDEAPLYRVDGFLVRPASSPAAAVSHASSSR